MSKYVLVLLMIVFSNVSVAFENENENENEIKMFMEVTQISMLIEGLPDKFNDAIELEKENRDDSEFFAYMERFKDSWNEDEINKAVVLHLKSVSKSDLLEMISWHQSESAMKINDLYNDFELSSDQSDAISYMNEVISNPLSKQRENALKGLVESRLIVEMTWLMTERMIGLINRDFGVELQDVYLENLKSQHIDEVKYQWFLLHSYMYKDISVEEMNDFLKYYESDIGQLERKITISSMEIVFDTYFENLSLK